MSKPRPTPVADDAHATAQQLQQRAAADYARAQAARAQQAAAARTQLAQARAHGNQQAVSR